MLYVSGEDFQDVEEKIFYKMFFVSHLLLIAPISKDDLLRRPLKEPSEEEKAMYYNVKLFNN